MIFIWLAWIAAIGIGLLFGARLGLLAGFLLAAVLSDMETRKIPNRLVLAGIVIGLLAQAFLLDGDGIVSALKGLVFGFGLFLPLYLLHVMGAGDVKLMALVGCFIGSPAIFGVVLCTLLAGGVLSMVFALKMRLARQILINSIFMVLPGAAKVASEKMSTDSVGVKSVGTLPYAMAIAVGTAAYLVWQGI